MEEALASNEKMKARIRRLERTNLQLKEKIQDGVEALKDARVEAETAQMDLLKTEEAHAQLAAVQEKLENATRAMKDLKSDVRKFRRWWLSEYQSLKVVVSLLPNPEDVKDLSSSADARFIAYSV